MNILLINMGSRGDINPFLALGVVLKEQGHQVTFITGEVHKHVVVFAGLNFVACTSAAAYYQVIHDPDLHHKHKFFNVIARYMMLQPMKAIYHIISQFNPSDTILISTHFMLAARLANEKMGFPLITICIQPSAFWSIERPPLSRDALYLPKLPYFLRKIILGLAEDHFLDRALSPELNDFRAQLNLPAVNKIYANWSFSNSKIVGLFPDWYAPPASDWPKHTELTGFVEFDENIEQQLPDQIQEFLDKDDPPLILTYGTANVKGKQFYQLFIETARKMGLRVIILNQYPEQLPALRQDRELLVSYVSLPKILPKSLGLIHHGGIGTLAQAIATSTPQLIVPFGFDQFDNAARVEHIGTGLKLHLKRYTNFNEAKDKIHQLIHSATIKNNCTRYSEKINFKKSAQITSQAILKFN
ncbi:MAG: glycosyltransferase family 1 protein [Proteobacteria bacterium]|nr:glycosyltransferase family 1 protein [Pseudomonadota bacterium]